MYSGNKLLTYLSPPAIDGATVNQYTPMMTPLEANTQKKGSMEVPSSLFGIFFASSHSEAIRVARDPVRSFDVSTMLSGSFSHTRL